MRLPEGPTLIVYELESVIAWLAPSTVEPIMYVLPPRYVAVNGALFTVNVIAANVVGCEFAVMDGHIEVPSTTSAGVSIADDPNLLIRGDSMLTICPCDNVTAWPALRIVEPTRYWLLPTYAAVMVAPLYVTRTSKKLVVDDNVGNGEIVCPSMKTSLELTEMMWSAGRVICCPLVRVVEAMAKLPLPRFVAVNTWLPAVTTA
jgi:hypothetical protein